jgi:hypothetical protein
MRHEETRDNTTAIETVMMAADSAEEILVALGHSPEAADQMVNPRDGANPTTVCPCGEVVEIEWDAAWGGGWDVCGVECPECGRRSCGGNARDATVNSWMTAREVDRSNAEFERMELDSELYAETGIRFGY